MAARRAVLASGECLLARRVLPTSCNALGSAGFATSSQREQNQSYQLLIVGGGTAGAAIANKFAGKLGKDHVAVIEPAEVRNCRYFFMFLSCIYKTCNTVDFVLIQ